jgi:hypothetical protein
MGKLSDATESWTAGCGATPTPVSATVCGEPVALSARLNEAVSVPAVEGLKVTVMVQEALVANDVPQVLVCA